MTPTEFLLARIAEDEAQTWQLTPYDCPPGCCAPAGWVGHSCTICDEGTSYGGTVAAITEIAIEHAERVHRRTRVLAECEAKRRIVEIHKSWQAYRAHFDTEPPTSPMIAALVSVYADHADYRAEWRNDTP